MQLRETERLWEKFLIAKTTFPSPRWDMSVVGAARSHGTRERREMKAKDDEQAQFALRATITQSST